MGGKKKQNKRAVANEIYKKESTKNESNSSPKGLQNLGNTCYFNSSLQCLFRVSSLRKCLSQRIDKQTSALIGRIEENGLQKQLNLKVPCLDAPLSVAYVKFTNELTEPTKSANQYLNPLSLRDLLIRKYPRFEGFEQHDSHELLRCLLDGLRQEDIKGWQAAILSSLDVNAKTASDAQKTDIRAWGRAVGLCSAVDRIFGGVVLTSLTCMKCSSVLQNFEIFLDLSLPIVGESNEVVKKTAHTRKEKLNKSKRERKTKEKSEKSKRKNKYSKFKRGSSAFPSDDTDEAEAELDSQKRCISTDDVGYCGALPTSINSKLDSSLASPRDLNQLCDRPSTHSSVDGDNRSSAGEDNNLSSRSDLQFIDVSHDCRDPGEPVCKLIQNLRNLRISESDRVTPPSSEEVQAQQIAQQTLSNNSTSRTQTDLERYLERYTRPEILRDGNQPICDNCTGKSRDDASPKKESVRSDCVKRDLILRPPAVLTIHLKRFEQVGYRLQKCSKKVTFPVYLELNPFCSKLSWNIQDGEIMYRLFSIVEHSGSLRGGHYVSYIAIDSPSDSTAEAATSPNLLPNPVFINTIDSPELWPLSTSQLVDRLRHCNRNFLLNAKLHLETAVASSTNDEGFYSNSDSSPPLNSSDASSLAISDAPTSRSCAPRGFSLDTQEEDHRKWFLCSDSHVSLVSLSAVLNCQPYLLFYERIR